MFYSSPYIGYPKEGNRPKNLRTQVSHYFRFSFQCPQYLNALYHREISGWINIRNGYNFNSSEQEAPQCLAAEADGDAAFQLPNHHNPNCRILKLLWKYYLGWWVLIYDQVTHQENRHPLSSQKPLWDPDLNWAWIKAHSRDYTKIAT